MFVGWCCKPLRYTLQAGQMLHFVMIEKFLATYFPQRLLHIVLQRFWPPLQGMLHWAMFRATCLVMALRDKLHEKLHSITTASRNVATNFSSIT